MAVAATSIAAVVPAGSATAAPGEASAHTSTCRLNSPTGAVQHVVELTFDNVHFSRDNPNVPSDLEQMPHLLSFLESNGTLLANEHTPLIAHTGDDILTTLTGVYGDQHGQPVANSYRVFNNSGTTSSASTFAYWTDPVAASGTTDTSPTMVTPTGGIAPAQWVPFTRAGCDVGAVATANMEIENPVTDVPTIYGANSPQEAQVKAQLAQYGYADIASADYEGIAVHCAQTSTSVCAGNQNAVADTLPDEPGGYQGYRALFGNSSVGPVVGGTTTSTGVRVNDLFGQPLTNQYASQDVKGTYYGFPGFDVTAAQTLGYLADMQEHGVPVTYGYIEDAHENLGPGDPAYEANLRADDQAFAGFFSNLSAHGINQSNTLFVVSADEGDHFAGVQLGGCDGVRVPCTYQPGQVGEVSANLNGLLAQQTGDAAKDFAINADSAPEFYVTGQPSATAPRVRQLEHEVASLTAPDPYAPGGATVPLVNSFADQTEQRILHMQTGDPRRTPTFSAFANPDFYVHAGSTTCSGATGKQTATGNPCVVIDPSYSWNHGDVSPDINTTWAAFAGPGVAVRGVDRTTWADQTDIRPTLMALVGLTDDHPLAGRVLTEDLAERAIPVQLRGHADVSARLGAVYKQLNADVGSFGLDTLAVSTAAVRSTDPATNADLDTRLTGLGVARDAVAGQMSAMLNGAAFQGQPINVPQADQLIARGYGLLAQAGNLSHTAA